MMPLMDYIPIYDWPLILGATLRLVRLLIADDLGKRLIRYPVEEFLITRLRPRSHWIVEGLSCPFCIGFWMGAGILGITLAAAQLPQEWHLAWELIMVALTLNYIAAHLGAALGDSYDESDDSPEHSPTQDEDSR